MIPSVWCPSHPSNPSPTFANRTPSGHRSAKGSARFEWQWQCGPTGDWGWEKSSSSGWLLVPTQHCKYLIRCKKWDNNGVKTIYQLVRELFHPLHYTVYYYRCKQMKMMKYFWDKFFTSGSDEEGSEVDWSPSNGSALSQHWWNISISLCTWGTRILDYIQIYLILYIYIKNIRVYIIYIYSVSNAFRAMFHMWRNGICQAF